MDLEKLIHCLQCCARVDAHNVGCDDCGLEYCGPECQQLCGTAATALSTLQAENEKLRAELERMKKIMRDNRIMTIPPKYPGGRQNGIFQNRAARRRADHEAAD